MTASLTGGDESLVGSLWRLLGSDGVAAVVRFGEPGQAQGRDRLVQDLGDRPCMILRHHGLLTVGNTVAEAFYWMYYLEQACKQQVMALAGLGSMQVMMCAVAL